MRLFLQEFSSGGGMVQYNPSASLLVEGFGILRVLAQNCKRLDIEVVATLDNRLKFLEQFLDIDEISLISTNDDFIENSLELLSDCDYFLVVAPGIDGILSSIIERYQKSSAICLNCDTQAVEFATNKSSVYEKFAKSKIRVPNTIRIKADELPESELLFPLVVKPNDGVDCEGVSFCKNIEQLKDYLNKNQSRDLLIQDYIVGDNLSILAYVYDKEISILSVNKQLLSLEFEESEYLGGISNIKHPLNEKIRSFGKSVLNEIEGLNGFVGVDLIVSTDEKNANDIYLIEINPRATTSVCGLFNQFNPPFNVINSKSSLISEKLNTCYFAKSKLRFPTNKIIPFDDLFNLHSIVTPPITFDNEYIYSLVRGFGVNSEMAIADYNKNLALLSNKLK
ncbi:MAG: ATP-grasp domain-containing protein [Asgard group archaeon]|nr:ATP-grasp domain-containing protein [Asgard group archaeon]